MLTLAMPQSEPSTARKRSDSCMSRVKIEDDRPAATALWSATTASKSLYFMT
ncbi:hypothetical protein FQZ97_235070 [compost metagenome]